MKCCACTVALLAIALFTESSLACLRPTMDERAVQWSTAIVEAKLVSIGQRVPVGAIAERQGPRGALGQVNTTFSYRPYEFEVTDALDGPLKKGQKVPVVRLFAVTDASLVVCSQHLTPAGVGKSFLLMLRPMDDYQFVWPNRVKKPDVKGAMVLVHLDPMENVTKDTLADLGAKIVEARAAEADASPKVIQREIQLVIKAPTDEKAEPAVRSLTAMGMKVLPLVSEAQAKASPAGQQRLLKVIEALSLPDPVTRVTRTNDPTVKPADGE